MTSWGIGFGAAKPAAAFDSLPPPIPLALRVLLRRICLTPFGCRFIRPKSKKKFREAIKPYTKRANGRSLEAIVLMLRPKLQGFFNYFKHVSAGALNDVDQWIRGRLRSILRKRAGGRGRGRGRDHQRWSNDYFTKLGFFDLEGARKFGINSLRQADNY